MAPPPCTDREVPALRWHRWILVALIALGVLSGLPALGHRIVAEGGDRFVELVADESTFVQLAHVSGVAPATLLARLKAVGVQGLGVPEDSLDSLDQQGLLSEVSGAEWLANLRAAGLPLPSFTVSPTGTYALIDPAEAPLVDFVASGLAQASQLPVVRGSYAGRGVVGVDLPLSVAGPLPLGFRPQTARDGGAFALAQQLGLDVVPRPLGTNTGYSPAQLNALFGQIASAGVPVHTVLFAGASTQPIPGNPDALPVVAAALTNAGWNLGVLETPKQLSNVDQPGTRQLDALVGERTVRVYSVPPWMLKEYTESHTVDALATSVSERNLRILYLHPYQDGPDLMGRTVKLYSDVAAALRARGYLLGPPRAFPQLRVHTAQRVVQGLAAVAAGLLLLELLFPSIRRYGYQPLAVLGAAAALLAVGSRSLSVELIGLAAAAGLGGLSMFYVAGLWHRLDWPEGWPVFGAVWIRAVMAAVVTAGITFAGALIVASLLADTPHFLEWTYFRGVKMTYLGIPVLAFCAFAAVVGFGGTRERGLGAQLGWLLEEPVRYKQVAVMLVVAAIALVYLVRSGNVSASLVPGPEAHLRQALEQYLSVRPREKEFLVGYPALFLGVLCAARRQRWGFLLMVLGASAAQVSVVDAFEHIRTPFMYSFEREVLGLVSGLLTGTVALAVVYALWMAWERRGAAAAPAPDPAGRQDP